MALSLLLSMRYKYQDTKALMALRHCADTDLRLVLEATQAATE